MTREEFKRHMKRDVHHGTGRTRAKAAEQTSAEIERQTAEYLANGGKIDVLPSEQQQPKRREAMKYIGNGGYSQ